MMLLARRVIKVHAWLRHGRHWVVYTTLVVGAELRGLVLAVVRLELAGHSGCIRVRSLLPAVVSIPLLVLLGRRRVAGRRWCLNIVAATGCHCGDSILEQASIHILIVHQLLVD